MYVFREIWHVLCSCSTRFKIRPLALLPKVFGNLSVLLPETKSTARRLFLTQLS